MRYNIIHPAPGRGEIIVYGYWGSISLGAGLFLTMKSTVGRALGRSSVACSDDQLWRSKKYYSSLVEYGGGNQSRTGGCGGGNDPMKCNGVGKGCVYGAQSMVASAAFNASFTVEEYHKLVVVGGSRVH